MRPGGYLVIVDQRRGTLRDWVPRYEREKRHYWIAETTVVREAREEGFIFTEYAEEFWHEEDPFVLVFQRPVFQHLTISILHALPLLHILATARAC